MLSSRIKAALSWRAIILLTAIFFAILRLSYRPVFSPLINSWTLTEELSGMNKPSHAGVSASSVALSAAGAVIGAGGPGWAQWNFSAPGPLPSTIEAYFTPRPGTRAGVYLLTEGNKRVTLSENLPLRDRGFNFQDKVKDMRSFSVRFEGEGAVLLRARFYQPAAEDGPGKGAALLLFFLALALARGLALKEPETAALAVLTAAGLFLRWTAFANYWNIPLEGDSADYWALAKNLKFSAPFANGAREPVFVWLLRLAGALFGDSERTARFASFAFSCSLVPMTWLFAKRLALGAPARLLAAGLAAFNPFSVFMSPQGLQLEFFTVLILAFSVLWLEGRRGAASAAGAALILTRIQSAAAVFPLALLDAWRSSKTQERNWPRFILPALALAVLLVSAKANTGSFTGNLDHAARYYTAAEEGRGAGQITLARYLFSSGPRLALGTVTGYFRLLFDPFNPFNRIFLNSHYARSWNLPLLPFLWMGLWLFLADGKKRTTLWLPLFFLSALPALQDQYREPRLLFHAAPFFFVLCSAGITFAAGKVLSLLKSRRPGTIWK